MWTHKLEQVRLVHQTLRFWVHENIQVQLQITGLRLCSPDLHLHSFTLDPIACRYNFKARSWTHD